MAAQHRLVDHYEQLMVITELAFADRHYEVAYHTLAAAMHCVEDLGDKQRLSMVEQTAHLQREWIDTYDPGHRLSSQSAARRGARSIYKVLDVHVDAIRLRLRRMRE
jgi:hypothetical protein